MNDIRFCFEFCLLIVALATTRRGGIKNGGGSGWECLGLLTPHFFWMFFYRVILFFFFPFPFLFPGIHGNDSLWFPLPKCGIGFFLFPSRSQILGMVFFHSLPVPKLWERIFFIPFPFPNLPFYSLESKRELKYCDRYQTSNIFSFLYITLHYNNLYNEEVNWAKEFRSEWLKRQDILLSFVANNFAATVLVIVNKIILFLFLFINSGRYNNKKTGDYQERRRMGLRMFGPKLFLTPHIC